jgi:hypothetical protein
VSGWRCVAEVRCMHVGFRVVAKVGRQTEPLLSSPYVVHLMHTLLAKGLRAKQATQPVTQEGNCTAGEGLMNAP